LLHLCGVFDLSKKGWQFFVLALLGITWGSSFVLMKKGLEAFNPLELARLRLAFAGFTLLPFILPKLHKVPKTAWIWLSLTGLVGSGIPALLFAAGITRIDSSLAGIINSTAPIFTLLAGLLFFGLRVSKFGAIGIGIGLVGTVFLILSQKGLSVNGNQWVFAALPLLGAICYGFSTNIIKSKLQGLSAVSVTGIALFLVGLPSAFWLIIDGTLSPCLHSPLHQKALIYVALLGTVGTALAVLVFNFLIRHTTVLFAASVTYLIPAFAILWGVWMGESLIWQTLVGMAIILSGVYLVNRR
jgi:drug/metabolite transporter (DMT)-like permease